MIREITIKETGDEDGEYILASKTPKLKIGDTVKLFENEEYKVVSLIPLIANSKKLGKHDKPCYIGTEPFILTKFNGVYLADKRVSRKRIL